MVAKYSAFKHNIFKFMKSRSVQTSDDNVRVIYTYGGRKFPLCISITKFAWEVLFLCIDKIPST